MAVERKKEEMEVDMVHDGGKKEGRNVDVDGGGHHPLVSVLFQHPYLTSFSLKSFFVNLFVIFLSNEKVVVSVQEGFK